MSVIATFVRTHYPSLWNATVAETDRFSFELFSKLFGVVSAFTLLIYAYNWSRFFGPTAQLRAFGRNEYWAKISIFEYLPVSNLSAYVIWLVAFILSILIIAGRWRRLSALLLFYIFSSMTFSNWTILNGEDRLLRLFALYLALVPEIPSQQAMVPAWYMNAPRLHVAMIYFSTAIQKIISDPGWLDGSAVYFALHFQVFSRLDADTLDLIFVNLPWISPLLTYSTLFVESLFIFGVMFRATRLPFVLAMLGFHLGVMASMRTVQLFNLAMLVGLSLFLIRDDWVLLKAVWARIHRIVHRT